MKAIVKSMWVDSADINLDEFSPDDPECFGLWIEFRAGLEDDAGADDFRLFVCTPVWLGNECDRKTVAWGRHMLIVAKYDLGAIKREIDQLIENCRGDDWPDIAREIAKFAGWEFEDYQP
jgi:hypothetical protein